MPEEGSSDLPEPVRRLVGRLPGLVADDLLGPEAARARAARTVAAARPAAVLVLLSPGALGSGLDVVLVERAAGPGPHAGQVALPGGGIDAGDASPAAAALREAAEEAGLDDAAVIVLGELPALPVPVSGYLVTPVLAWQPAPTPLVPGDPREIAAVHRVPVGVLADPGTRVLVSLRAGAGRPGWTGPGFVVGDLLVWGFTAVLLDAILRLAGLEREWSRERLVEPPLPFAGTSDQR